MFRWNCIRIKGEDGLSPLTICIVITSLEEERANLSAFRTFVRFALVWFCLFPLPLGVWEGLRLVLVAFPGTFHLHFLIVDRCNTVFLVQFPLFVSSVAVRVLFCDGVSCYSKIIYKVFQEWGMNQEAERSRGTTRRKYEEQTMTWNYGTGEITDI